jgi:hypothetical protein
MTRSLAIIRLPHNRTPDHHQAALLPALMIHSNSSRRYILPPLYIRAQLELPTGVLAWLSIAEDHTSHTHLMCRDGRWLPHPPHPHKGPSQ